MTLLLCGSLYSWYHFSGRFWANMLLRVIVMIFQMIAIHSHYTVLTRSAASHNPAEVKKNKFSLTAYLNFRIIVDIVSFFLLLSTMSGAGRSEYDLINMMVQFVYVCICGIIADGFLLIAWILAKWKKVVNPSLPFAPAEQTSLAV